jgi:hypothetical protein
VGEAAPCCWITPLTAFTTSRGSSKAKLDWQCSTTLPPYLLATGGWNRSNEVGVVHVQIDQGSTDAIGLKEIRQPQGVGDDPFEGTSHQSAVFPALDDLASVGVFRKERQHVADQ